MRNYVVGQKLLYVTDDFEGYKEEIATVKQVFEDHILIDVPSIHDHCWIDDDFENMVKPIWEVPCVKKAIIDYFVCNRIFDDKKEAENVYMSELVKENHLLGLIYTTSQEENIDIQTSLDLINMKILIFIGAGAINEDKDALKISKDVKINELESMLNIDNFIFNGEDYIEKHPEEFADDDFSRYMNKPEVA